MGNRALPLSALASIVVLIAPSLPAQAVERTGAHFVVQLHPGRLPGALAARLADEALATAEAAAGSVESLLAWREAKPSTLHVHADEARFRELCAATGSVVPQESFADYTKGEVHVLLWPQLSTRALELVGLPDPARDTIVRSAAQLVASQFAPHTIEDPWLLAVFGFGVLEGLRNPEHLLGVDPAYDTRRMPIYRLRRDGQQMLLKSTILDFAPPTTQEMLDDSDAHRSVLARVMAAMGKDWPKKLLAKPPKKASTRAEIRFAAVEKALGSNWIKTESTFAKLHQQLRPRWQLTAPMASRRDQRLVCVGTTARSAQFQAIEMPPNDDYSIRGRFQIQPCDDDSFRIQLDWTNENMIGCFFGVGKYRIERWQVGGDWTLLAEGPAPIVRNQPFEGVVEVGKELRILVDDQEVAKWNYGDRTMRGRWSFGVSDCVVWVEDLRLERASTAKK